MSRPASAGPRSAASSTSFPGRSRARTGSRARPGMPPDSTTHLGPARNAAPNSARCTSSPSVTAGSTASATRSARSTTCWTGRRPAGGGAEASSGGGFAHEPELVRVPGERLDDERDVLALVDAELLDPALDLIAVDLGGERRLLQLLAHRFRLHSLDPRGADERACGDEP